MTPTVPTILPAAPGPAAMAGRPALAVRDLPDDALAALAAADAAGAFDELARRYQVPLLWFLLRSTRHLADAEDALQDTFRRLYASRARFTPGCRYRPWAFAVARRVAVDAAHARRRDAVVRPLAGVDPAGPADDRPADLDACDRVWDVARGVLTEEQAQALWLFHVESMPAGEIAMTLGRSWVSVKAMLVRARRRVRDELLARDRRGRSGRGMVKADNARVAGSPAGDARAEGAPAAGDARGRNGRP